MAAISALAGLLLGGASGEADMMLLFTVTGIACNLLGVKYGAAKNRRLESASTPSTDRPAP